MWTTQEERPGAKVAQGEQQEVRQSHLTCERVVWYWRSWGGGWGQPRGLTLFGQREKHRGFQSQCPAASSSSAAKQQEATFTVVLAPNSTLWWCMRWVSVNTFSWRRGNQPKFHMDGEAWKGGRCLSWTDRQWWTAALGNLDQENLRIGNKKKRKGKKKAQHPRIQTMHLTRGVISRASNRRLASQPLHCVQISLWRKLSLCAKRMEINSRLSRALSPPFFFLLGRGGAGAAKLGGVLMSTKSDEDVCRKLGREGGCHFCQKPWVSEKPLQKTWGGFSTRKRETQTFSISSVKNWKGARQRGNEGLNI